MRAISSLDELDMMLAECDRAATDDDLRQVFTCFEMAPSGIFAGAGTDPLSGAYHAAQMAFYERISGRAYTLKNEHTPFDVAAAIARPFPYSTGSCTTAGDHFITIGQFLKVLRLAPGSRILELGPGWGNLTLALAALGHRVTAVDVEPRFCDLIRTRASQAGLDIDVVNADFGWVASVEQPYDAVVFFECFHHAADHLKLLRDLHHALKPGGRIYLGAEPILADFPVPWGLRMDGQSLWSIRKFGWMELGFNNEYFEHALAATGWSGTRHAAPGPATWELRRSDEPLEIAATDARFGSVTGRRTPNGIQLTRAASGYALFGPYVPLAPGNYVARLWLDGTEPAEGRGKVDVCVQTGAKVVSSRQVAVPSTAGQARCFELLFTLEEQYDDVEVRFTNDDGFTGCITKLLISPSL